MTAHAQPAVLSAPMPFEANAGVFSGRAPAGTQTIRVLVDGRRVVDMSDATHGALVRDPWSALVAAEILHEAA
jgi:hypothetical protein